MKKTSKVVEAKVERTTAQKIASMESSLLWGQDWKLKRYEDIIIAIGDMAGRMRQQANELERTATYAQYNGNTMYLVERIMDVVRNDRVLSGLNDVVTQARYYEEEKASAEKFMAEQRAEIVALKAQLQQEQEVQG